MEPIAMIAELIDTVEKTIGYGLRVRTGGQDARLKDAELQSPPGYYARPNDADETGVGTEDVVLMEIGDYRLVLCSHNSRGWKRLLDYLARALDKGETVITAEDGTNRCYLSLRPDGTLRLHVDGSDLEVDTTGITQVDDAADDWATRFDDLKSELDAWVLEYNAHGHTDSMLGVTTTPQNPPGGPASTQTALTAAPKSTKLKIK
jgi:hypothetical protein